MLMDILKQIYAREKHAEEDSNNALGEVILRVISQVIASRKIGSDWFI